MSDENRISTEMPGNTTTSPRESSRTRITIPAILALLGAIWLAGVDYFVTLRFGGTSVSGLLTIGTFLGCLFLFPATLPRWIDSAQGKASSSILPPLTLVAFLVYAVSRLATSLNMEGLQNVCVYGGFILVVCLVMNTGTDDHIKWVERWYPRLAITASVVFLSTYLVGFDLFGDRSFALAALVFLAVTVPQRHRRLTTLAPALIVIAAVLSLSRTATILCIVLFLFSAVRLPRHRGLAAGAMAFISTVVLLAVILLYPPFTARFTTGDNAVKVGGTAINTSGRTELWSLSWKHAMESPWIGHGPGSNAELIQSVYPNISHPHNDYIRVLHDFGTVGLFLWVAGNAILIWQTAARARRLDRAIDWAALMAMLGLMAAALTDNVIVYPFIMLPTAVLVGLSLAGRPQRRPLAARVAEFDNEPRLTEEQSA